MDARLLPQITATDKFIQRVSRGRVTLLDIAGLPNLMLTVNGRKSGVPRAHGQDLPNYARYAERTDRIIPVFLLDPQG